MSKPIDDLIYAVEKNIERNCEDTEYAITKRIALLEKRLTSLIKNRTKEAEPAPADVVKKTVPADVIKKAVATDDDDDGDEGEEEGDGEGEGDEDGEGEGDAEEGDDLRQSMSEKFELPVKLEDAKVSVLEGVILDVNIRVEELEGATKLLSVKINELIKVNNALLKRLEGGAQFSKKKAFI